MSRVTEAVLGCLLMLGFTAAGQPLVFEHAPDGGKPWPVRDVYAMAADGSNYRALTSDGHSHNPAWAPDGRQILFIHDDALRSKPPYREQKGYESYHPVELYVMNADGGGKRLLRRIEPVIYSAAWSPDGKTLALTCRVGEGAAGLYRLPADGQGALRLLVPNAFTPAWSPDGKKLAFSVEQPRGQWAVHVADADGSHDVRLTDPARSGGEPAWSPDGRQIAFAELAGTQVVVMGAGGSHARAISNPPGWSCSHPSWSPDGARIAMSCRASAAPCGMVSSVGTILPECERRIFTMNVREPGAAAAPAGKHDGAWASFAAAR